MAKRKRERDALDSAMSSEWETTSIGESSFASSIETPRKVRGLELLPARSPEDRFKIKWKGPRDPRALRYAVDNNLSYWYGRDSKVVDIKDGQFLVNDSGGLDQRALDKANEKYNKETRKHHERDFDYHTGSSLGEKLLWRDRTRGEKLRRCAKLSASHQQQLARYQKAQKNLLKLVKKRPQEVVGILRLRTDVDRFAGIHKEILRQITIMELAVSQETEPGWAWQAGLRHQDEIEDQWKVLYKALNREESPPVSEIDELEDCREPPSASTEIELFPGASKATYREDADDTEDETDDADVTEDETEGTDMMGDDENSDDFWLS